MVSKGLVLHWLTNKRISNRIAEAISILNVIYCLLALYALYLTKDIESVADDYASILNITSILVLAAFIAIFISIWPKTRSREELGESNYEDPSYLVLAIVLTTWTTMLMLKIRWIIPIFEESQANYSELQTHILNVLDIINSSFFLLATLQFDFDQDLAINPAGLKKIVTETRNWLNEKSRISKLTLASLLGYVGLVVLQEYKLLPMIPSVHLPMIPLVLFGLFTILVLGTFLEQLYRERRFGKWLRRAVNVLMVIAAFLTILGYFEVTNIPDAVNFVALTCYRFGLAAVFLLLGFSLKERNENALRLRDTLLHTETQSSHFAKKQIDKVLQEIENLRSRETVHPEMLNHLYKTLRAIRELNKLIFTYRSDNIKGYSLFENFQVLTTQLSHIFYFWREDETAQTRINMKHNDLKYLKAIAFSPQQQLDLLRLVTEICLNGNSAYSRNYSAEGYIPGEIKIRVSTGKKIDNTLPKLIIGISNDAPVTPEDLEKIDQIFEKFVVTPESIRNRIRISTSLGLYVVKGICQLNGWAISRLKGGSGVFIQVYIPLN